MTTEYKVNDESGNFISYDDICEEMMNIASEDPKSHISVDNIMNLFKGIIDYGFENPTPIQAKTIIPIFKGRDVIAQSQAGTGKTGAFTIGCLSRIDPKKNYPQAMILANTRELAQQTNSICKILGEYAGIRTCLSIGEYKSVRENIKKARHSHLIVGTPGRVENIINEGAFDPEKLKIFVLDEADELLSGNFIDPIRKMIQDLGENTQICVFSATFGKEELRHSQEFTRDPLMITLKREEMSLSIIKQYKVTLSNREYKMDTLFDLYEKLTISQAVIFANKKDTAIMIHERMMKDGHIVGLLHGGMTSHERIEMLRDFRKAKLRALIATNVMSRGIDVQQIGLIFNYDIPYDPTVYLHRIGRSGRYGKIGVAINFVVDSRKYRRDMEYLDGIEKHYGTKIVNLPMPEEINDILRGGGE
jgi:translation initiation factor 4A